MPRKTALHDMRTRSGRFDPRILDAAERLVASQGKSAEPLPPAHLPLSAVLVGQVLLENLVAVDGRLLLKAGTEITPALLERVRSFARLHPVREPVVVERRRVA